MCYGYYGAVLEPPSDSLTVAWIKSSVLKSMLAIASSRIIILLSFKRARTKHSSYFCLTLKIEPSSETDVSRLEGSLTIASFSVQLVPKHSRYRPHCIHLTDPSFSQDTRK
jgi:hypothetical protein